ncbi:UMP/CMP kinase [Acididesulfobacillus acetoxydans]|uniref:Cytidylate kinase n=1 Tax=Acididesulfobacillus acetoxydans TaxID=1561005 RepID=A0A8S0WPN0_9FIRM|nr:(d)CMP kinase [Acididesulfobacillus acetoxydans]CAA7602034.1 UMP/CMP kinase [Acididesulfobacillus acetoxydans]CEJ08123.1 Cytidylate kinase [Acididesulfobacillus acetoxydans]
MANGLEEGKEGSRQIAIDGPAGSGKSTVAKKVAERLGIFYLDTGAMYRALAYKAVKNKVPLTDEELVSRLAYETDIYFSKERGVWCDGEDVTQAIRTPEVSRAVSLVASYPGVRKRLVELQQAEAERRSIVMDGRDIGTHVLPQAGLKIFLTAEPEVRARRRWQELKSSGKEASLAEVVRDLEERDRQDRNRVASPLRAAPDAVILDTTRLDIEETVARILDMARGGLR